MDTYYKEWKKAMQKRLRMAGIEPSLFNDDQYQSWYACQVNQANVVSVALNALGMPLTRVGAQ